MYWANGHDIYRVWVLTPKRGINFLDAADLILAGFPDDLFKPPSVNFLSLYKIRSVKTYRNIRHLG
jgi:hypothetical protein